MLLNSTNPILLKHTTLSFEIELRRGQCCGLWGENGSGKSSFFYYLKSQGHKIFKQSKVAFLTQNPLNPLGHLNGVDLIKFLQTFLGESFDANLWHKFLNDFPLWKELILRPISKLSGGEAQLLKVMSTFVQKAQYYFLDEPAQHLDQEKRNYLVELIEGKKLQHSSFLVTDHYQDFLLEVSEEMYEFILKENCARISKKIRHEVLS